jgi:ABC-type dipeptide/oligopeptide/nickel transport system permease subunit
MPEVVRGKAARTLGGKGQSLWKDAWRRLRRNKAAMAGLVIVVLMSFVAAAASWLIPFQPDYGQPWIRAQPPGYTHPAVLAENWFEVGKTPVVPDRIPPVIARMRSEDGTITFLAQEIDTTEYRIKIRRGRVDRIARLAGAERVDRVEVAGAESYLQVLPEEGEPGPPLRDLVLERRKPLPDVLATDARILIVRVQQPKTPEPETIEVRIEGGEVASITRDGKPHDQLHLEGRFVRRVAKDGRELRLRHLLGTDLAGRDVLSRVIYGGQISLMVGAVATIVSVLIGVVYGAVAGYQSQAPVSGWGLSCGAIAALATLAMIIFPWEKTTLDPTWDVRVAVAFWVGFCAWFAWKWLGRVLPASVVHKPVTTVGEVMMRIVDILYSLPFMFLVILLMISFGRNLIILFVALGCVQWLMMARIVRGQVLSLREKEFIEAARMSGTGHLGIIFRHLVPNTLGVVIVYATLTVPAVILQESFLAFIGLTVEWQGRTLDSWGSLVNQGRQSLTSDGGNWWVLVYPSIAMAVTLFSLNFLGDGLRDALDPQLKGKG